MLELGHYVCAGYVLSRWTGAVDCTGTVLRRTTLAVGHPQRVFFPDEWALGWVNEAHERRLAQAAALGIPAARLDEVVAAMTADFETGFAAWHTIFDIETARAYARRFLAQADGVELWGIGLHESLVVPDALLEAAVPSGPGQVLARRARLAPGGTPLGHELLTNMYGSFDSPESLHADEHAIFEHARIPRNALGLVDSLGEALRACEELGREPIENAPDADWLPWLLVDYPLR